MPIYTAKLPQVPDTPNDSEKSPHHDKEGWRLRVVFFMAAFGFVSPTWGVKQYKSDAQTLEKNGVVRKKKIIHIKVAHDTKQCRKKMRNENQVSLMRRLFERENEQLMLAVYHCELQEMLHLAEYGY